MRIKTLYICNVCETEYATERAALFCEAQPIEPQPAFIGETVFVRERYGEEDETRVVTSAKVIGSHASGHLDRPESIELLRVSPELCSHRWELHVNKPVMWGKDEESFQTYLVSFSFVRNGEKSDNPERPANEADELVPGVHNQ